VVIVQVPKLSRRHAPKLAWRYTPSTDRGFVPVSKNNIGIARYCFGFFFDLVPPELSG
jgi:hypothetical protein